MKQAPWAQDKNKIQQRSKLSPATDMVKYHEKYFIFALSTYSENPDKNLADRLPSTNSLLVGRSHQE